MQLRPYQKQAIEALKNGGLAILPQGSGKSIIIQALANDNTLITTSRNILLEQLRLRKCKGDIINRSSLHKVTKQYDQIIIDEAHEVNTIGQYHDFLKYQTNTKIIALTATPYRLDMGHISKIFGSPVFEITREELSKYLAPREYPIVPCKINVQEEGSTYLKDNTKEIVEHILKNPPESDTVGIIFCINIKHAEIVHTLIPGSKIIHSKTKNNDEILKNPPKYLINVELLTTGYDHPPTKSIYLMRNTDSYSLYEQIIGRGDRPYNDCNNKIYDYTLSTRKLGVERDNIAVCYNCGDDIDKRLNTCPTCNAPKIVEEPTTRDGYKQCPECNNLNRSYAKFCIKCRHILLKSVGYRNIRAYVSVKKEYDKYVFSLPISDKYKLWKKYTLSKDKLRKFVIFLNGDAKLKRIEATDYYEVKDFTVIYKVGGFDTRKLIYAELINYNNKRIELK
jgi:DNA repair protein RadD